MSNINLIVDEWKYNTLPILFSQLYPKDYNNIDTKITKLLKKGSAIIITDIAYFINKPLLKELSNTFTLDEIWDGIYNIVEYIIDGREAIIPNKENNKPILLQKYLPKQTEITKRLTKNAIIKLQKGEPFSIIDIKDTHESPKKSNKKVEPKSSIPKIKVTHNKIDKLVKDYFDSYGEEVSPVMIKYKLDIITKYWNDERLPSLLFALYEPLYEKIESSILTDINNNIPIRVSKIASFIDKNIFKRLIKNKTINQIYDGIGIIIHEHPNVKIIEEPVTVLNKYLSTKSVTQKDSVTSMSVTSMFKQFIKIRDTILKQLDKETKLKTTKAKINSIEKAAELLVELKNMSTMILTDIKDIGGFKETKQSVMTNIKDLEDRIFTKYNELDSIVNKPKQPSPSVVEKPKKEQIKKDIKKIYKQSKPKRSELEDPLSVLSPRSRSKAEKALDKIVITPEMVLPLVGQNIFKTKPKTPKPITPKPQPKTYEQRVNEREQKIKNNEEQVKKMTIEEIREELRKYGWTKNNLSRNTRTDLENKLLFSMMPTMIIDIPDDYED